MVPVIEHLVEQTGLDIHPLIWALAFGACFGGNGTLVGASANLVTADIAGACGHKISFCEWLQVGFPIMIISTLGANVYLYAAFFLHIPGYVVMLIVTALFCLHVAWASYFRSSSFVALPPDDTTPPPSPGQVGNGSAHKLPTPTSARRAHGGISIDAMNKRRLSLAVAGLGAHHTADTAANTLSWPVYPSPSAASPTPHRGMVAADEAAALGQVTRGEGIASITGARTTCSPLAPFESSFDVSCMQQEEEV